MKKYKLKYYLSLFLVCLLLLTSCSKTNSKPDNDSTQLSSDIEQDRQSVSQSFDAFLTQLFQDEITLNTINLHYTLAHPENFGISSYPISLGDFSEETRQKIRKDITNYLSILDTFDYKKLTKDQQITYDILEEYLLTEKGSLDLYLYQRNLSPTIGDQAQLPILLAEYEFYSKQDVEDYLKLIITAETYLSNLLDFQKEKSEAGFFMSDTTADGVIAQCQNFIQNPEENYLLSTFNERLNNLSLTEEELSDYQAKNKDAILHHLIPAYQKLIDGLTALKGTGKNDGGLCHYEKGTQYYQYLIRSRVGTDKSLEDIKNWIEAEIANDLGKVTALAIKNPDLATEISDYSFPIQEPDECLKDLQQKICADFPEAVSDQYTIKYVPASLQESASPAFYLTPPLDNIDGNVIYINKNPAYTSMNLYTTLAHEGYPGHLYQNTYFNNTNPHPIRSILNYSGYSEGWATYVELYAYSYSGLNADLAEMLSYNLSLSLGLYSRVDVGVNYEGWDIEQVNRFLRKYGISDKNIATEMYQSMVDEPANYLSYYLGYLEFKNLKETAQQKQAENFHLKEFHKFILDFGPAPFYILKKYMS